MLWEFQTTEPNSFDKFLLLYFSSNLGIKNKYKTRVEECHTFCISLEMSSALDSTLDSTGGRNLQKSI